MNGKQQIQQPKNPTFSLWEWIKKNPLFLLLIGVLVYVFFSWITARDNRKPFDFLEENGKVKIIGLEKKELDNILELTDDKDCIKVAPHYNGYEYSLPAKNEDFWRRVNPAIYYTYSKIEPQRIRQALMEKEGIIFDFNQKNPVKLEVRKELSALGGKERVILPKFIENLLFTILFFLLIDIFFGTKIISSTLSMINLRKPSGKLVENPILTFKDIGGLHEAKEELQEIISYFRNPKIFHEKGIEVPKGILLVGQPGNGKTLLAKGLAGECKLPFIYRSAPEFEKGIIGWGAAEVRNTFAMAKNYAHEKGGCFVFVDEIDAIAGKRYQSIHSHHETLNQLLSELDGFSSRENVIFLAATNNLNHLDSALLRPGRFDRRILIPLPNFRSRKEIISLCIKKKSLRFNIDLEETTSMTDGLSGAQIVNIFNEAAILSLRHKKDFVDQETIFEAFDRALMGPSFQNQTLTPEKKMLLAYHEAGHAIVGLTLPETTVKKITITPRWTAGGYTWVNLRNQKDDAYLLNRSQILAQVTCSLGGRASEELLSGREHVTVGAYSDFKRAFALVHDLVLRYGMSELGIVSTPDSPVFGEESLNEMSEIKRQKIEKETEKILDQCQQKAQKIIQKKKNILSLLAKALVEKNTLQKEEINYIFVNQRLPYIPLL